MKKRTFKVRFFYGCRGSRLSPIFVEYRIRLSIVELNLNHLNITSSILAIFTYNTLLNR